MVIGARDPIFDTGALSNRPELPRPGSIRRESEPVRSPSFSSGAVRRNWDRLAKVLEWLSRSPSRPMHSGSLVLLSYISAVCVFVALRHPSNAAAIIDRRAELSVVAPPPAAGAGRPLRPALPALRCCHRRHRLRGHRLHPYRLPRPCCDPERPTLAPAVSAAPVAEAPALAPAVPRQLHGEIAAGTGVT